MNDRDEPAEKATSTPALKKRYARPELRRWGTLTQLTEGGNIGAPEGIKGTDPGTFVILR